MVAVIIMSQANFSSPWWQLESVSGSSRIVLSGAWRLDNLRDIQAIFKQHPWLPPHGSPLVIDGQQLEQIDTSGALLMLQLAGTIPSGTADISLVNFHENHYRIITLVKEHFDDISISPPMAALNPLQEVGHSTMIFLQQMARLVSFIGQNNVETWRILRHPRKIRWKELVVQIQRACLEAIPIIMLVTLLIGVVVAYLSATQIKQFGANIFVVDGIGIAMCRELSPMIVAIVVAGRTGSAYTAQIGTMKLNEELDAMVTLGLSPMQVLVLPRVLALVIALPLLVFIGDLAGIFGGMVIAKTYLEITTTTFVTRLQDVVTLKTFLVGIAKAPIFAAFIAVIGCRMGLNVENNASSVGMHTTSTVVQSFVSVILLDALFAIICVQLGI
ncbi:MAG: MlaE family lipid ABC transporter permease subunit [Deltaproteobacteria bacterium]|nr:MlaE family lipid ABC transporter permease subunit [Deltaproteobacteria bacterium]